MVPPMSRLLKQGSSFFLVPEQQYTIRKIATLAVDSRMNGMGGVKRPPFPTEESKRLSFGMLNNSKQVGQLDGTVKPSNLVKPGPSIKQIATVPR